MTTYLPSTFEERLQMLASMGCTSFDELYADVPGGAEGVQLNLPQGLSELELRRRFEALGTKNSVFTSIFRGAGAYWRFRPALIDTVMGNETFVSAYTPYQAEISQGILQVIFEYQSMNCELTGMDAACASVYDGATAAAEAVLMCQERKRSRVVISAGVNPHTQEVVRTYCQAKNIEVCNLALHGGRTEASTLKEALDSSCACMLIQQPNYFGILEEMEELIKTAHEAGAKAIVAAEPVSLGILESPGALGADICSCEGQSLGLPLSFGGPYVGMLSCKQKLMRKLPGRIVGETVDTAGRRAFVLTLQAREQHIRREKASSNICSNEALCALGAAAYMAAMGPTGLRQAALNSYANAQYLASKLCEISGIELIFEAPFFNEFVTTFPGDTQKLEARLADAGILGGLPLDSALAEQASDTPLDGAILWCATEMNTKEHMDTLIANVRKAL